MSKNQRKRVFVSYTEGKGGDLEWVLSMLEQSIQDDPTRMRQILTLGAVVFLQGGRISYDASGKPYFPGLPGHAVSQIAPGIPAAPHAQPRQAESERHEADGTGATASIDKAAQPAMPRAIKLRDQVEPVASLDAATVAVPPGKGGQKSGAPRVAAPKSVSKAEPKPAQQAESEDATAAPAGGEGEAEVTATPEWDAMSERLLAEFWTTPEVTANDSPITEEHEAVRD